MGNIFKKSLSVYDTRFGFFSHFKKGTLHVHMNNADLNGLRLNKAGTDSKQVIKSQKPPCLFAS